jgi:type II secretory ATPase GspE/PulE/Tfp pilus assembly ATPase PilB-like protein
VSAALERAFEGLSAEARKEIPQAEEVLFMEPTEEYPRGVKGRAAVFEMIEMNRELERVILARPTEEAIMKVARAQGMLTMREDAICKALRKEIPWEEVNKL